MPKEELVKIAGLSVLLVRSSRKTLAVQIRADGTVIARAPLRMPKDRILCFLSEKASWIRMQQGRMQEREKMRQQARIHLDAAQEKELRERAKSVLAQRTAYFARQIGVTYGRITVRDQKTRWGSCSQTGNLNFNFRLILAPLEVLDYVVVHELCHRRQMNHSTQFWQEVAQVLPDYRKRKAWLTENGWRLMGGAMPCIWHKVNADKHSPASSARSDCECPLY